MSREEFKLLADALREVEPQKTQAKFSGSIAVVP
jgi:hypothetical protein